MSKNKILDEIKKIAKEAERENKKFKPYKWSFWGSIKRAKGTLELTKNDNRKRKPR
jgi:hypothetical protein